MIYIKLFGVLKVKLEIMCINRDIFACNFKKTGRQAIYIQASPNAYACCNTGPTASLPVLWNVYLHNIHLTNMRRLALTHALQRLGGSNTSAMVELYAHLALDQLAHVASRLNQHLLATI
ncbi:MAG: hypothetical protein WC009_13525 [Methylotenera sp.]